MAKAATDKLKDETKVLKAMAKKNAPAKPARATKAKSARAAAKPIKERIQRKKTTNPRLAKGKIWLIEETLAIYKEPRTKKWIAQRAPRPNYRRTIDQRLEAKTLNGAVIEAMNLYHDNGFVRKAPPISRARALRAVKDLIAWTGDNPEREGLKGTPDRVVRAYEEFFAGYTTNPDEILATTFAESGGYDEMIALVDIPFESHCEHHMVPFVGKVHIAYWPDKSVVGISKLARLVEAYGRRLQIQEKMTTQIADTLQTILNPLGVIVVIEATHMCMTARGVKKQGVKMKTSRAHGIFRDNDKVRNEFFGMIRDGKD
jgi:GTP cyclohydrolase IA